MNMPRPIARNPPTHTRAAGVADLHADARRRPMFVRGIGTAAPPARYTKADCLQAFERSSWLGRLDGRAHQLARTVLQRDNGIDARRLAVTTLDEVFAIDPNTLAQRFLTHAPPLAAAAAQRALAAAGVAAAAIDAVVVSTCTGRLCPGLSGYMVELLGLRQDVLAFDLVGQGCAAALPNLQLGQALLGAGTSAHVLSVCVEVCSAAMYLDNDPGVLISACLFGDGAGAAVLGAGPGSGRGAGHGAGLGAGLGAGAAEGRRSIEWIDSASLIDPGQRHALEFEQRDGMQRNILTRAVPALAATAAQDVLGTVLERTGVQAAEIGAWIFHAGGRDVLQALQQRLALQPDDLRYSAAMLREYGNLSSAFVYFVLEAALADRAPGPWWWLSSFGAGFSCHGALLAVHE